MSISWTQTSQSSTYQEGLKALESYEPPAVGFVRPKIDTLSVLAGKIVKQNNFIIQLLVNISERIENCEENIKSLKAAVEKGKAPATEDFSKNLEHLTQQLDKIRVSEGVKPAPKESKIYVHKDPYKIFEEEKKNSERK